MLMCMRFALAELRSDLEISNGAALRKVRCSSSISPSCLLLLSCLSMSLCYHFFLQHPPATSSNNTHQFFLLY
jgi:hypothetical protein